MRERFWSIDFWATGEKNVREKREREGENGATSINTAQVPLK